MARTTPDEPTRVHHVFSLGAKLVTAAAALATVLGYVHSVGLNGSATRRTVGTFGAAWIGLAPAVDTLWALGDTVHLAATVTDRHGTALVGASIVWSSTDSLVAPVVDGQVVARRIGTATIVSAVGDLLAKAVVVVHPRVAALHLASDSAVDVAEGDTRTVSLRGTDARGHVLTLGDQRITWRSGDTLVVVVDTNGRMTGVTAGRTTVSASVAGVSAQMPVTVLAEPGTLSAVSGSGQCAGRHHVAVPGGRAAHVTAWPAVGWHLRSISPARMRAGSSTCQPRQPTPMGKRGHRGDWATSRGGSD